jgi:hypothetical protein
MGHDFIAPKTLPFTGLDQINRVSLKSSSLFTYVLVSLRKLHPMQWKVGQKHCDLLPVTKAKALEIFENVTKKR